MDQPPHSFAGLALRHTPVGVAILYGDALCFRYTNPAFRTLLRLHRDVVGECLEAVLPQISPDLIKLLRGVIRSSKPDRVQAFKSTALTTADGGPTYWSILCDPTDTDGDGQTDSVTVTLEDVTETVLAENALYESESRFRGIFETAAVGIALLGLDGRWLQVNHTFPDMLGHSRGELLQSSVTAITHPDDRAQSQREFQRLQRGEIERYRSQWAADVGESAIVMGGTGASEALSAGKWRPP